MAFHVLYGLCQRLAWYYSKLHIDLNLAKTELLRYKFRKGGWASLYLFAKKSTAPCPFSFIFLLENHWSLISQKEISFEIFAHRKWSKRCSVNYVPSSVFLGLKHTIYDSFSLDVNYGILTRSPIIFLLSEENKKRLVAGVTLYLCVALYRCLSMIKLQQLISWLGK